MALDSYLRYQYLDERARARKEARDKSSLDMALAQLARKTASAKATAEDISGSSQQVSDIDTLNQYIENIDSMKVGVDYVDTFLDAHKDKVELRKRTVNAYNSIDENIQSMLDNVVSSGEPTEGFLAALEDEKKNLSDIAGGVHAPAYRAVQEKITRAGESLEFINRMSRFDTDITTPEIDWEQTGEREVIDSKGVKSMQPIYAHDAHTRGFVESIIKPEADVGRKMKDFEFANKLLALLPGNIRTEKLQINTKMAKQTRADLVQLQEDVIANQYAKAMGALGSSKDSLASLFKQGTSDVESLLASTSTQLEDYGGMSKDAQRNLPVRENVKSIESDMFLLIGIAGKNKIRTPYMKTKDGGPSPITYPDTYDPIDPKNRATIDRWISKNIWDKTTGFKRGGQFFIKTKSSKNTAFQTAMVGYIKAREELLKGVDMDLRGTGWSYPEYPLAGDQKEDDIINPYEG